MSVFWSYIFDVAAVAQDLDKESSYFCTENLKKSRQKKTREIK